MPGFPHFYKYKSNPFHCSFFCLHKVSHHFCPRNNMCHFLDSPQRATYFMPLLGLGIYFIILLLSCQYTMGRGLGSQATLLGNCIVLSNPDWFASNTWKQYYAFVVLIVHSKQTKPKLLKFILQTPISVKFTNLFYSGVFVLWFWFWYKRILPLMIIPTYL